MKGQATKVERMDIPVKDLGKIYLDLSSIFLSLIHVKPLKPLKLLKPLKPLKLLKLLKPLKPFIVV